MGNGPALPANPFFASPEQRVALARQRFFEEGVRPSGLVSEAVLQSWSRCLRRHPDPARPAVFEPVTPSRVHGALRSNRDLLQAAGEEMVRLRLTLAGTSGTAILTDANGVVIGTTFSQAQSHERLMPVTTRVGVNLAEEVVGTTAPGITAHSGEASVVRGGEHFFGNVHVMHCAAAPIRDVRGRLAGVLDLSSEGIPFGFDAGSVVAYYAAEIENRLLCAQSTEHLVVRLQIAPSLLDTPMAALLGITGDGRIDWLNGAAARLLGLAPSAGTAFSSRAADSLGMSLETLAGLSLLAEPQPAHLPNGLMVWLRSEWRAPDGGRHLQPAQPEIRAEAAERPSAAASATLRETEHQTIVRVHGECGGNISKVARALGVSRGRIYRHLRQAGG
jgi:transcriptional regulator of acetoin/glycerol metabolism